jgi:hypothetical protein
MMTWITSATLLAQEIRGNSDGALVYPLGHHASIGVCGTQVEIGFQKETKVLQANPIQTRLAKAKADTSANLVETVVTEEQNAGRVQI